MKLFVKALGVLLVLAMTVACSNSDGSKAYSLKGTAVFFHNIEAAPELQLDAINETDRNGYGTVSFEHFGSGIVLSPKTWHLQVVDERGTVDTIDDQVVLDNAEFSVEANKTKIIALTGTYDTAHPETADLQVHTLAVAEDTERSEDNQELVQYINFSHLDKDLGLLNIYLVTEDHSTDSLSLLTPVAQIDFGQTSAAIRLERLATEYADYYLRISAASAPTVEIFNSGKKRLYDYAKQTILISPNLSGVGSSPMVAFYYGSGNTVKWFDKDDNIGALRVFDGLRDSVDLDVIADNVVNDAYDKSIASNLVFDDVSPFVTDMVAEAGTYVVKATEGVTPVPTMIPVDIGSAEFWTVVLYGRTNNAAGIPVKESRNASGTHASVTFINASYFDNPDDVIPFNVHIKKADETLGSSSVSISELDPGSYKNILKPVGSYEIYVTKLNNNVIDYLSIDLLANTNYTFVIVEDASSFSGYAIIQL